jgi:hypothetical protein
MYGSIGICHLEGRGCMWDDVLEVHLEETRDKIMLEFTLD